jgi:hypothetical protein
MGLRFRRRFTIIPGIRLNVSKSGVSASIGRRGAWFTFGGKGTRTTVGIPGTGISYTTSSSHGARQQPLQTPATSHTASRGCLVSLLLLLAVTVALSAYLVHLAAR